jgi:hypothetical protein
MHMFTTRAHMTASASGRGSRFRKIGMRKVLIAAAFSAVFAVSANALEQGGTIISVDEAGKSFTCHWGVMDKTYKTTDKTVFRVGQKDGAWSDLRVGATVYVAYHPVGEDRVAYKVEIKAP